VRLKQGLSQERRLQVTAYVWLSQQYTLNSFDAAKKELPKILNFTNAASTLVNVTNQPSCPFELPGVQVEPVLKTSPL
jgi:hypothetical protein